jgi:stage II sporulation protein AA (anti-sigma F factor antagonist)
MKVEVKEIDKIKVIKITGQIRISTQNEFKDLLDNIARESATKTVVLSLDGVIYMNSAGLGIIVDTLRKFKEKKGRMVLCSLMPNVSNIFEITRINRFIEIYKTEQEAIAKVS